MMTGMANQDYVILAFDDDMNLVDHDSPVGTVDQLEGDDLEIWNEREDGFLFVYSVRLKIGYWVHPKLITIA